MKHCFKCKLEKTEKEFAPSQYNKSSGWCYTCWRNMPSQCPEGKKKYRERNKERFNNYKKEEYIRKRANHILYGARERSKLFNLEFNLTIDDIVIPSICPILGIPIRIVSGEGRTWDGPSIDRIDNEKGYVKGNIIIVSDEANVMKSDSTQRERELICEFYTKLIKDKNNENMS